MSPMGFPINLSKRLGIDIFFMVLLSRPFGLNTMTRCSSQDQWHETKVKYLIWDDLIMYTKIAWERVVKYVKISTFLIEA